MKNYNKILEAVNRGIQLALDDYEDIEDNSSVSSDVINTKDVIKEKIDLMKEVVDLGLPSGTLWCKYNLDVNPNQLSKAEDWYGGYYAWGELEGNKTNKKGNIYFNWTNYKFAKYYSNQYNNYVKLTKYCYDPECGSKGFIDNLTKMLPEDDAAYQNKKLYNFKFHIPTKEQCEELINYTTNYWVNNYNPNKTIHDPKDDGGIQGLNGRVFEGKNANQLFIPAAGQGCSLGIWESGSRCDLWSSNLSYYTQCAYQLNIKLPHIRMVSADRYFGCNIRPVVNL